MADRLRLASLAQSVTHGTRRGVIALLPTGRRRHAREVEAYVRAIAGVRSQGGARVLIFAQGRTGTTLLESLLSSTGLFRANDEPLRGNGSRVFRPALYLRGLSRDPALQGTGGNFICHVKVYHLTEFRQRTGSRPVDPRRFIEGLVQDGWQVIHVRRENAIRQVMSRYVAQARGGYHKLDDAPESIKIMIDREDFAAQLALGERRSAQERAALANFDYHEIVYERDLLDPGAHEQTVDRVFDYLGLERTRPVTTPLRKINTRPLSEIVANYDDFAEWVGNQGLTAMLDAPPDSTEDRGTTV